MSTLVWNDNFDVGIHTINNQHKKLIDIINNFNSGIGTTPSRELLEKTFFNLIEYHNTHFRTEEKILAKHNYPEISAHVQEHKNLIDTLYTMKDELHASDNKLTTIIKLQDFLRTWWNNHIIETDKKYGKFLNEKGIK